MDVVTFVAVMALRMAQRSLPSTNPAAAVIGAPAAPTDAVDRWDSIIAEAAMRFAIPEAWIRAVMRAESAGQTTLDGRPITSRAGAMGLMQIMPETYADMRRRFGLGPDPYEPRDNILAGAAYLHEMLDRFGYPALFAAYNAGPERFETYIRDGQNLPTETWNYLRKLGPGIAEALHAMGSESVPTEQEMARSEGPKQEEFRSGRALFFVLGEDGTGASATRNDVPGSTNITAQNGSLFVSRSNRTTPPNEPSNRLLFVPLAGEPR